MRLSFGFISLVSLLPGTIASCIRPKVKETKVKDLFKPIMARVHKPADIEQAASEEIRRFVPDMHPPWLQFFATAGKVHGLLTSCLIMNWKFWKPFLNDLPKDEQTLPELIMDVTINGVVKTYGMLYQNHKYLSVLSEDDVDKVITSLVCEIANAGEKSTKTVNHATMHAINEHYLSLNLKDKNIMALHVHEIKSGGSPFQPSQFNKPWNEVLDLMYSDSRHSVDRSIKQKWIEAYTRFVRQCDAGSVRNIPEPEVLPLLSTKALDDLAKQCALPQNARAVKVISYLHRSEKTYSGMAQFWTNDSDLRRFAAIAMISIEGLDEFGPDIYHWDAEAMVEAFLATEPYKKLSDGLLQSPTLRQPFIEAMLRASGATGLQVPDNIDKYNVLRIFIANNLADEPVKGIVKSPSLTVSVDESKNTLRTVSNLKPSAHNDDEAIIGQKRPRELTVDNISKYYRLDAAEKKPLKSVIKSPSSRFDRKNEGARGNQKSTASDEVIGKSPASIKNQIPVPKPKYSQDRKGIFKSSRSSSHAEEEIIDVGTDENLFTDLLDKEPERVPALKFRRTNSIFEKKSPFN